MNKWCQNGAGMVTIHGQCWDEILVPIAILGNYSFTIVCNVAGFDAEK